MRPACRAHTLASMPAISEETGVKWAGELQDGTMQGLAALRMLLEHAAGEAIRQLEEEIGDLRALIAEMRGQAPRQEPFGNRQTEIKPRSSA
jgi:hypothetical protein